jgi:hypothetical protein
MLPAFRISCRGAFIVPLFLFLLHPGRSLSQDSTSTLGIVAASTVPAVIVGGALYQNYTTFWKNDDRGPFYFSNDPPYAMHNDKFGHAWFSSMSSDLIRLGYREAGLSNETAAWLGFGFAAGAELMVEVEDGFRAGKPYYGFSFGDASADIAGASLPLLRHYFGDRFVPDLKMSIWPSSAYAAGAYGSIFDDNESQFFWLSFDVPYSPDWLNVAVGHGVENLDEVAWLPERHGLQRGSQLYLAPDLDLSGLPIKGKLWEIVSQVLSHIRMPLPALQLAPRVKWWWLR